MKFIHIADVHLSMKPDISYRWSSARASELYETFNRVIDICNRDKIDLLLIAGDLFHHQPSEKLLREVDYSLSKLTYTQVVLMAGNHDYAPIGSQFEKYVWNEKVHMVSSDKMESVYLDEINTEVYGFSYGTRNIMTSRYDDVEPYDTNRINILLGHGGEPDNVPIDFNKLRESKFDYVALGHIHKPQIIGDKIAYSGSLEPLDKTEQGEHGYIYGELDKDKCMIKHVPFAKRQYIKLSMEVDSDLTNTELIDRISEEIRSHGIDNIYTINIEGFKAADLEYECDNLKEQYNIINIEDTSLPDYNFRILYEDNIDNIIGMYISKINGMDIDEDMKNKALYYGVDALMKRT